MIELSPETRTRIQLIFPEPLWHDVEDYLLNECGDNLPLIDSSFVELAERIRFAVLKCCDGDYSKLKSWCVQAKQDWRDVLMAAGFGNSIKGHLDWRPSRA